MPFKFYYAHVRARGSVQRYVLDHSGANWEEIDVWQDKCSFMQELPKWQEKYGKFVSNFWLEDLETGLTYFSTMPILVFLGEKFGYLGKNEEDKNQILAAVDKLTELREAFLNGQQISPGNQNLKTLLNITIPSHLKMYEQQLIDNATKFLFCDTKLSIADFYLFSLLHTLQDWKPDVLNNFPKIAEFYKNMLLDEKIRERHEKEKQIPWVSAGNVAFYLGKMMGKEVKKEDVGKFYGWGYDLDHMKPAF